MECPAHLPLASWHLREGEVCGQLRDFLVTDPRPPSLGHWLLRRLLGKRPVGGAALPQRQGPSGLTDLASLRHGIRKEAEAHLGAAGLGANIP